MSAFLAGCALVAFGGCSKPAPATPTTVHGTVTFQGQPFMQGWIVFAPDREKGNDGVPHSAMIALDGTYKLTPEGTATIAPGWYRIALADPPNLFTSQLGYPPFPAALRRPDHSGLSREVKAGEDNVLNFDVEVTQ